MNAENEVVSIAEERRLVKGVRQTSLTCRNSNANGNGESKELKSISISAAAVLKRAPLSIIPRTKPTFTIFCDDDVTQDAAECSYLRKTGGREPLAAIKTDFSSLRNEESENRDPKVDDEIEEEEDSAVILSVGTTSLSTVDTVADEDNESLYGSAADETSLEEYVTAPAASEKEEHEDRMYCHPDYVRDIYNYMRSQELILRPRANYMSKQTDINSEMRVILVDWLGDVACEYELALETLHLAVSIVDRTLSIVDCPRLKLQLVGATAVMLASKFEEIYPPELKEYVYITDDTYTSSQILRMERVVLSSLRFQISAPTSNWFASRLARIARTSRQTTNMMNYLLELALLDDRYLKYRPSVLACAALCLANILTCHTPWPKSLEADTEVSIGEMLEPLSQLLRSFNKAPKEQHKAFYEKYADMKYDGVACLKAPSSLPAIS